MTAQGPAVERDVEALAEGATIEVGGQQVTIHYDPDLVLEGIPRWGMNSSRWNGTATEHVVTLRRWDERVFLHEVLHILLGKHFPAGSHAYDHSWVADPKHEEAVRTIEDGLWDMGWRRFGGVTQIDPSKPRLPPMDSDATKAHILASDWLAAHVRAAVEEAVEPVRALHYEAYPGAGWCGGCHDAHRNEGWPCPTTAALPDPARVGQDGEGA